VRLYGEFNGWNPDSVPLAPDWTGIWSVFLPDDVWAERLRRDSPLKARVVTREGEHTDRIPAFARRVAADDAGHYTATFWLAEDGYTFRNPTPPPRPGEGLRVYEAHVGMAREEPRVGTYAEFAETVLPRAADLGYNAVQLMAVQEHPYYASFGYHVSNFYAVSSRFGTPTDLKRLIDTAHGMGLRVLLDLVHSHAVKNTLEGLNRFDGTDDQYFHPGERGEHPQWDSKLFDYGRYEVLRFLLSNVRYWLEEFRFDGFRFDGVTSMLYHDHGVKEPFASYEDYFGARVDEDALLYLQMANELAHRVRPDALTVAEDVSGMAGLARPVAEGGVGFDYRLAMGVPDFWIETVTEKRDEEWGMGEIYHALLNRRRGENHVGYVESHDQALVGDKTLSFRLMDAEMYHGFGVGSASPAVDRGVALHKMIRLVTFALSGEGYLNFMGNEFGHPEWIDFPREGNGNSFQYARRQWSLADNPNLRYRFLLAFDRAMLALDARHHLLTDPFIEPLAFHEERKLLLFRRGPLVFAFNFHPSESYTDCRVPFPDPTDYRLILDTDAPEFGGHARLQSGMNYPWLPEPAEGRAQSGLLYLPSRSAQVLSPVGRVAPGG
jgi:1,4-alpha-glucan branching enzyme